MTIGICTRANRGVPGGGFGVFVIVVAVPEAGPFLQEKVEPIYVGELITIAVEVVPPKLVNHKFYYQLRSALAQLSLRVHEGHAEAQRRNATDQVTHALTL